MPSHAALYMITLVLVSTYALAGCIGGEDDDAKPTPGAEVGDEAEDVRLSADAGTLQGAVASWVYEPLGGAEVELIGTEHRTTVADNGEFVINDIPPGQYTVWATAVNYQPKQIPVDILANQVSKIQVLLDPMASDAPYVEEWERTGIVDLAASWQAEVPTQGCLIVDNPVLAAKNCGGIRWGGENGEIAINVTDDVETIHVALVWQPAGPLGRNLQMDLMCPLVPRGGSGAVLDTEHDCYFDTPTTESPIVHRVDAEDWQTKGYNHTGDWAARVFATYGLLGTHPATGVDVGLAYQQTFTFYVAVHHREPAPPDFVPFPDA